MRARETYLGTRDLVDILGVGRTRATEIMHMFEDRGQLFRTGKLLKVKASDLDKWMKSECLQPSPLARRKRRSA